MGRIVVATNFKKSESVLSNVPACKLHTWVRVVSTTHASLEIQVQQYFETFQISCVNYLARPFSHAFARHRAFLALFAFLHFCIGAYLFFHHCLRGKFNI